METLAATPHVAEFFEPVLLSGLCVVKGGYLIILKIFFSLIFFSCVLFVFTHSPMGMVAQGLFNFRTHTPLWIGEKIALFHWYITAGINFFFLCNREVLPVT